MVKMFASTSKWVIASMVSNVDIKFLKKNVKKINVIKSVLRYISKLVGMDLGARGKMNVSSNTLKKIITTKLFFRKNWK